jgi:5,6-dimethylbenzimidazole synthase
MDPSERFASNAGQSDAPIFSNADRTSFYTILEARRDMRHFLPGASVDPQVLERILSAAHHAPSVGLMQPWRYIRIVSPQVRDAIVALVAEERLKTAEAMAERKQDFLRLKVEGVRECAELFVVAMAPDDGTVFGRRTLPYDTALGSVACSIQNFWLAARAENLGMGWVSLFDPKALSQLLGMPEGAKPVAVLCLGPVKEFYSRPMLEQENWRHAKPLDELYFCDAWNKVQQEST